MAQPKANAQPVMIVAISGEDDVDDCGDEYDITSESLKSLNFSST